MGREKKKEKKNEMREFRETRQRQGTRVAKIAGRPTIFRSFAGQFDENALSD